MSEREEDLIKLRVKKWKWKWKTWHNRGLPGGGGGGARGSYISSLNVSVAYSRLCRHCRKFGRGRLSLVAISYWRTVATFWVMLLPEFTLAGPHNKASSTRTSAPSDSHHYLLQHLFFHGHSWPLTSRSQTDLSSLRKHPLLHPLILSRGLKYIFVRVLGGLPLFDGWAYNRNRDKADLFQIRFEFTAWKRHNKSNSFQYIWRGGGGKSGGPYKQMYFFVYR